MPTRVEDIFLRAKSGCILCEPPQPCRLVSTLATCAVPAYCIDSADRVRNPILTLHAQSLNRGCIHGQSVSHRLHAAIPKYCGVGKICLSKEGLQAWLAFLNKTKFWINEVERTANLLVVFLKSLHSFHLFQGYQSPWSHKRFTSNCDGKSPCSNPATFARTLQAFSLVYFRLLSTV